MRKRRKTLDHFWLGFVAANVPWIVYLLYASHEASKIMNEYHRRMETASSRMSQLTRGEISIEQFLSDDEIRQGG